MPKFLPTVLLLPHLFLPLLPSRQAEQNAIALQLQSKNNWRNSVPVKSYQVSVGHTKRADGCSYLLASKFPQDTILSPFSIALLWKPLSSPKFRPANLNWIQVRALNANLKCTPLHKTLVTEWQEALNQRKSALAKSCTHADQLGSRTW